MREKSLQSGVPGHPVDSSSTL